MTMTTEIPPTPGHEVHLERLVRDEPNKGRQPTIRFRGICSCGVQSDTFSTSGMVWGWEAGHRGI